MLAAKSTITTASRFARSVPAITRAASAPMALHGSQAAHFSNLSNPVLQKVARALLGSDPEVVKLSEQLAAEREANIFLRGQLSAYEAIKQQSSSEGSPPQKGSFTKEGGSNDSGSSHQDSGNSWATLKSAAKTVMAALGVITTFETAYKSDTFNIVASNATAAASEASRVITEMHSRFKDIATPSDTTSDVPTSPESPTAPESSKPLPFYTHTSAPTKAAPDASKPGPAAGE